MSKRSFHYKSLELGYYPTLSQMIRSSGFSIFKLKNKWKNIMDSTYGRLFLRSFSFFFSADFSSHSFLKKRMGEICLRKKSRRRMPWKRPDETLTNVHSGVIDAQSRYAGINTIALWNFLLESNFVVSLILPPIN